MIYWKKGAFYETSCNYSTNGERGGHHALSCLWAPMTQTYATEDISTGDVAACRGAREPEQSP